MRTNILTELLVDLLDEALAPRFHLVVDEMHLLFQIIRLIFVLCQLTDFLVKVLDLRREGTIPLPSTTILLLTLMLHLQLVKLHSERLVLVA